MSSQVQTFTIDPNSETWRAVEAHIKGRLFARRVNVEQANLPPDETENQRGAIEELVALRALVHPLKPVHEPHPVIRITAASEG